MSWEYHFNWILGILDCEVINGGVTNSVFTYCGSVFINCFVPSTYNKELAVLFFVMRVA